MAWAIFARFLVLKVLYEGHQNEWIATRRGMTGANAVTHSIPSVQNPLGEICFAISFNGPSRVCLSEPRITATIYALTVQVSPLEKSFCKSPRPFWATACSI